MLLVLLSRVSLLLLTSSGVLLLPSFLLSPFILLLLIVFARINLHDFGTPPRILLDLMDKTLPPALLVIGTGTVAALKLSFLQLIVVPLGMSLIIRPLLPWLPFDINSTIIFLFL